MNADCATAVPGVWAIGDAVRGPCLHTRPQKKASQWRSVLLSEATAWIPQRFRG